MTETTASMPELEDQIEAARQRLKVTVDELAFRARPSEVARREVEAAKRAIRGAMTTPDGEVRPDRAAMVAGVVFVIVGLVVLRRRRRR